MTPFEKDRKPFGERDRKPAGEFEKKQRRLEPKEPEELPENMIYGRNPVMEAVKSGRDIEKILMAKGEISGSLKEIMARARDKKIVVQQIDRARMDQLTAHHQGVIAYVSAAQYSTVEEILETAKQRGEDPFVVVLDGITDPHNVGAIARSALCAGAHGLIVAQRRASGLTPAAVKTSAGAFEYLKTAKVTNIARTLEELKEQGLWVFGAAMNGEAYTKTDLTGPIALVIGAEGDGISRLVLEKCDRIVSIPLLGPLDSLNASCAAAILMYEVVRARGQA